MVLDRVPPDGNDPSPPRLEEVQNLEFQASNLHDKVSSTQETFDKSSHELNQIGAAIKKLRKLPTSDEQSEPHLSSSTSSQSLQSTPTPPLASPSRSTPQTSITSTSQHALAPTASLRENSKVPTETPQERAMEEQKSFSPQHQPPSKRGTASRTTGNTGDASRAADNTGNTSLSVWAPTWRTLERFRDIRNDIPQIFAPMQLRWARRQVQFRETESRLRAKMRVLERAEERRKIFENQHYLGWIAKLLFRNWFESPKLFVTLSCAIYVVWRRTDSKYIRRSSIIFAICFVIYRRVYSRHRQRIMDNADGLEEESDIPDEP